MKRTMSTNGAQSALGRDRFPSSRTRRGPDARRDLDLRVAPRRPRALRPCGGAPCRRDRAENAHALPRRSDGLRWLPPTSNTRWLHFPVGPSRCTDRRIERGQAPAIPRGDYRQPAGRCHQRRRWIARLCRVLDVRMRLAPGRAHVEGACSIEGFGDHPVLRSDGARRRFAGWFGPGRTTWLRIARVVRGDKQSYVSYSSRDGATFTRGPVWDHDLGATPKLGLVSFGGAGFTARFDHMRVRALPAHL